MYVSALLVPYGRRDGHARGTGSFCRAGRRDRRGGVRGDRRSGRAEVHSGRTREARARDGHGRSTGGGAGRRAERGDRRRCNVGELVRRRRCSDVPLAVVTVTSTVPALPAGALAVIDVALSAVIVAAVVPKSTAVAALRFVPVMVTDVPPAVEPLVGETAVTVGGGLTMVVVDSGVTSSRRYRLARCLLCGGQHGGRPRGDGSWSVRPRRRQSVALPAASYSLSAGWTVEPTAPVACEDDRDGREA